LSKYVKHYLSLSRFRKNDEKNDDFLLELPPFRYADEIYDNICFQENWQHFFLQKLAKIAVNSDHNIGPWF
jgi:hypothetical protein